MGAQSRAKSAVAIKRHRTNGNGLSFGAISSPTAKRFDINYFFFADSSCRFFCVSCCFILWSVCRRAFLRLSDFVARESHSHFGLFTAVASVRAMGQTDLPARCSAEVGLCLWNEAVERNVKPDEIITNELGIFVVDVVNSIQMGRAARATRLGRVHRRLDQARWPDQLPGTTWENGADNVTMHALADERCHLEAAYLAKKPI